MAEVPKEGVRIYCLCGQKMRVPPSAMGRPGKCVACRQKIRIPRADELEAGSTEVYLRDHPEFLREPNRHAAQAGQEAKPLEPEAELAADESPDEEKATPLDVLESLRVLCSFEHVVQRELAVLAEAEAGDAEGPHGKATLLGYRSLLRTARQDLENQLEQRLDKVSDQLRSIGEQIARANLALRVGEMDYVTFVQSASPLRNRREDLELRRQNLRGWLAVKDPYMAGGLVQVRLEEVPCEGLEVTFPVSTKPPGSPVPRTIEALRKAFENRERAEKKLRERQRMQSEGALSDAALEECRADSEAARGRARAAVAFYRARLAQVAKDADNDVAAIKAHLDVARTQLQKQEMSEEEYQSLELALLRGQSDNTQSASLAKRAMRASGPDDLPQPTGTFLRRISHPGRSSVTAIQADSWLTWTSAILLMITIIVLMLRAQIGGDLLVTRGMVLALFLAAAALSIVASVPRPQIRTLMLNIFWPVLSIGAAAHIHETRYSTGTIGEHLRAEPLWMLSPDIALLILAMGVLGAAAWVASAINERRGHAVYASVLVVTGLVLVFSDFGGVLSAHVQVYPLENTVSQERQNEYAVVARLDNTGKRSLYIGGEYPRQPSVANLYVERRGESGTWIRLPAPDAYRLSTTEQWISTGNREMQPIRLQPGGWVRLRHTLGPGTYRTVLLTNESPTPVIQHEDFTLDPIELPLVAPEASRTEGETVEAVTENQFLPTLEVEVALRGVIAGGDEEPVFHIELTWPGGQTEKHHLQLGDEVVAPWTTSEYHPARKTLTLSNGDTLLVLSTGQSEFLEVNERR